MALSPHAAPSWSRRFLDGRGMEHGARRRPALSSLHARAPGGLVSQLRVWLVGFGVVGRWVASALDAQGGQFAARYGRAATVVGIGNARDGFSYDPNGHDLGAILAAAARGRPITEQGGARVWPSAIEGLRATDADLLVEVTASPSAGGEPGLSHMREALQRRIPVVTSNKWPVALRGADLAALARRQGVAFRAESTVMSGTPVLSTLTEGLAGSVPLALRGVLNATANHILSQMADGLSFAEALAEAQRVGLAEPDPGADVEGHDTAAKVMILSTLAFSGPGGTGTVTASVQPQAVPADDLLARVDGATNALVCQASPVGEVTIIGPGAGPHLAGQGVLSDIIAVVRQHSGNS